tara:strand:- start:683 stop:1054 length:372 start_codon:yes stop_codon:yes gene_type:complete
MALTDNNAQDGFNSYSKETALATAGNVNILTSGTGSVFSITISNGSTLAYFKMFDSTSITHGTTQPVLCVPIPASGTKQTIFCSGGIVFSTSCSVNAAIASGGQGSGEDGAATTLAYIIYGGA